MPVGYSNMKVLYLHEKNQYLKLDFEAQIRLKKNLLEKVFATTREDKLGANLMGPPFI